MQPISGMCMAYFTRYFYNITSDKCETFIYGGCGDYANNFESIDECNKACNPRPDVNIQIQPKYCSCTTKYFSSAL